MERVDLKGLPAAGFAIVYLLNPFCVEDAWVNIYMTMLKDY